ncbi:MAG: DUF4190 domain-containing protein [Actinobacteria bacterium]|nr:DUF4190 domain-containing protein [Actinomycetota bacterium]
MDGSNAFDFPLGDLSPGQHAALAAALAQENIDGRWTGSTLHVDIAYEARVTTLVDQARAGMLPAAPVPAATPPGSPPTAPPTITPTAVIPEGVVPAGPATFGYGAGGGYAPGTFGSPGYAGSLTGYGSPGYYPPAPRTNGLAVASLVCSLIGLACGGPFLSIPAVVMGHMARRQIRNSGGAEQGEGIALAGLIIGYIGTGLFAALMVLYILIIVAAAGSSGFG